MGKDVVSFFDENAARYDRWYDEHPREYQEQIKLIKDAIRKGNDVEIGVGTGRFAQKLGIKVGVDPSEGMLRIAAARGIFPILAYADRLPFISKYFDFSLFVVTLCFLEDPVSALKEAKRVSKDVFSAIIEKGSSYADFLEKKKEGFYAYAHFYSERELLDFYSEAGLEAVDSIYSDLETEGMRYRFRVIVGH
ncbi:hypothetical protein [Thermoplasma volcanium GSS1]|uniref:Methyltransferase type 11 domain-containing protein n=1 Tax=Thermoplasma volcanium (strain ATCC 51530 / DSM 4299 / JCM 9571 / NBRC 15438 / GSS1) TaxID=273116 RepID=Q97CA9_THEVO|nr:methyltransferase domain-containing protein [Thermoplasma volcanium]BAB59335.1 hypothetical protein [Thermoplasma volcanium GSS1]